MYFFQRFECNLFEENPSSMSWATIFQSLKYFISFLVPSEGSSLNGEGAGGKRNDRSRAQFPFKRKDFKRTKQGPRCTTTIRKCHIAYNTIVNNINFL